jgi:CRISPR associated protein, Cas1 family
MVSGSNRQATHPVHAVLNYAYAVLESQVRIATVAQGLDPTIGYLHASRPARRPLSQIVSRKVTLAWSHSLSRSVSGLAHVIGRSSSEASRIKPSGSWALGTS